MILKLGPVAYAVLVSGSLLGENVGTFSWYKLCIVKVHPLFNIMVYICIVVN